MSFVGTRPEATKYVEKYSNEMLATLLLPAGITSEASIRYKDEAELLDSADDVDRVYIEKVLALFFNSKEYYDVNFTSLYLLLPTLLAFYGAIKGKKKNKIWYMGATGINIIGILLLGSRGTFLPVAAIMLFLILKDNSSGLH